jgi:HK97 family phage major capsid protein
MSGLNTIASRQIRLLDVMSRRGTNSDLVSWVYQANKDGSAGQTGEGSAKNQIDFDLVVGSESIKKTTAYIKVTTEMLDDIDFIQSEIEAELMRELLKAVEAGVYEGDGLSNNLNGIRTVASSFSPGSAWTGAVDNANNIDVLVAASDQIQVAEHEVPNFAFMYPTDINILKATKVSSTDKRYVERLSMVAGELLLDGVTRLVPTTLVTQGEYLIGNFNKAILVEKGGIDVQIGLDGNDFTENTRTILAEWRGAAVVKNNDRTAFVAGTFATDKETLETT